MPERILVVDDEKNILDILGQHLQDEGYDLTLKSSPSEALAMLDGGGYSLVITDLRMPEMSGIDVVQAIRARHPDISIIVVTAMLEVTSAIQAMRAGADDYVLKPFDLSEISMAVAKALEKRNLVIANRRHQEDLEQIVREATQDLETAHFELLKTKEYLERLINSTVDAIFTVEDTDTIGFANRGAKHLFGYPDADLLGESFANIIIGGRQETGYIRRVLGEGLPLQNYETEVRHRSGKIIPVSISLSMVSGVDDDNPSILAICKDITEQKRLEQELKEMTIRDSLTGLYNQRYFYDRLEAEVERAKRQNRPLSLLLIDIDRFKSYNDSRGHLEGDRVLQEVGKVITLCTREHVDFGFRYGGDEFTVILPEADEDEARRIAERIRETFEQKRFDLLTMSIGLMSYTPALTIRTFIQIADSMMYDAKRSGGNRVYVYNAAQDSVGA